MKKLLSNRQAGVGHLGLILAVVVLGIGGVGYFVYNKNKGEDRATDTNLAAIQEAVKNAKCEYDDKDLCKFFTSYKVQKYYNVTTVTEADGETITMALKSEGDGKSHIKMEGGTPYEVITIGNTTYTKAADGTWWKQTTENNASKDLESDAKVEFDEPDTTEAAQATYKKIGKEACGNLTCFKYQEVDPGNTATTTFLWFDDKDYQLRRTLIEGDGTKSDSTFSYDKVSIKEPSPVKELGPNQYLLPGQGEPQTIPSYEGGDTPTPEEIEALMRQYQ